MPIFKQTGIRNKTKLDKSKKCRLDFRVYNCHMLDTDSICVYKVLTHMTPTALLIPFVDLFLTMTVPLGGLPLSEI